jgi:glycosyltransferase involved in cell wall biosynthesis
LRIAIKVTHITTGGGLTHLNSIIEWFGRLAPETQFVLIGKRGQEELFKSPPSNFDYRYYNWPSRGLASQLGWEWFRLPAVIGESACDLLFEPGNYGTLSSPCPKITLVHNIAPFDRRIIKHESLYQKARLILLRHATLNSIGSSNGIIFVSNYERDTIAKYMNLAHKETTVIYHGGSSRPAGFDSNKVFDKYGISQEFILCASHIYRYKNILQMVCGYIEATKRNVSLPPLIIAGADYDHGYMTRIQSIIRPAGLKDRIKFLGSICGGDLGVLYRECRFFVFPSTLESCGNIMIEALGSGCAILSSNRAVMPEICRDAALYCDPYDIADIAEKLRLLNSNEALLLNLRRRALNRARDFSWEKTALQTLEFMERISGLKLIAAENIKTGDMAMNQQRCC